MRGAVHPLSQHALHACRVWAGKAVSCCLLTDRVCVSCSESVQFLVSRSVFKVDSPISFYTSSCIIHLQYVTALLLLSSRVGQLCPCLLRPCVNSNFFSSPYCWRSTRIIALLFAAFLTLLHNSLSNQA